MSISFGSKKWNFYGVASGGGGGGGASLDFSQASNSQYIAAIF
jgi:hypothetical protein